MLVFYKVPKGCFIWAGLAKSNINSWKIHAIIVLPLPWGAILVKVHQLYGQSRKWLCNIITLKNESFQNLKELIISENLFSVNCMKERLIADLFRQSLSPCFGRQLVGPHRVRGRRLQAVRPAWGGDAGLSWDTSALSP
jgi:hypothetical protein